MKLVIISGTVFGTSEEVAYHAEEKLKEQGIEVVYNSRITYEQLIAEQADAVLFICSTTGMGELPDTIYPIFQALKDNVPNWQGLPSGVIALGDQSYGPTFCGAGEQIKELLDELGTQPVSDMLRLDASATVTPELDAEPWLAEFAAKLKA